MTITLKSLASTKKTLRADQAMGPYMVYLPTTVKMETMTEDKVLSPTQRRIS